MNREVAPAPAGSSFKVTTVINAFDPLPKQDTAMPRFIHLLARRACLCVPLLLAACGGGGGGGGDTTTPAKPSDTPSPSVATAANDPSAGATALVTASGYQSTLGTQPVTATGASTYAVTIEGTTFSLDFSGSQIAVNAPAGAMGYEDAFVMLCSAGKADTVISHPQATSVTPATQADIVGKRFVFVDHCTQAPDADVLTINADGSVSSRLEGLLPASELTAYLSTDGLKAGSDAHIGHIYKVLIDGATRYVIVEGEIKNGTQQVFLLVEQITPASSPAPAVSSLVAATGYSATLDTASATSTGTSSYDIAVAGKSYSLDFAGPQVAVTAPAGSSGYEDAFVMLCTAGKADAVVANPQATSVTPATQAEIVGKHFLSVDHCVLDTSETLTFNADGSVTSQVDGIIPASEISAYLSPSGFHDGTESFIGHIYKVVAEGTTRYVVVEGFVKNGVSSVRLLTEQAP